MSTGQQWSTRYRPATLGKFLGQPAAVAYVRGMIKSGEAPSCLLISGPSGTGKTTLARIISRHLSGWDDDPDKNPDVYEMAANVERSIDDVRAAIAHSRYSPRGGKRRCMIVDEAQGLVGPAGGALLKAVEEPAPKSTWILCTNEPWKLNRAMLNRAQQLALSEVADEALVQVMRGVLSSERASLGPSQDLILEKIAKFAHGVPRQALQMLEAVVRVVAGGGSASEALRMAVSSSPTAEGFDASVAFVRALMAGDERAAIAAVAGVANPDGMVELINQMVGAAARVAAGQKPRDGLGWAVTRAIKVSPGDLHALLNLQARTVAALDVRTRYTVPSESILLSLARKV